MRTFGAPVPAGQSCEKVFMWSTKHEGCNDLCAGLAEILFGISGKMNGHTIVFVYEETGKVKTDIFSAGGRSYGSL